MTEILGLFNFESNYSYASISCYILKEDTFTIFWDNRTRIASNSKFKEKSVNRWRVQFQNQKAKSSCFLPCVKKRIEEKILYKYGLFW